MSSSTSQTRMGQILDENDHTRCSQGNQRALLVENLDRLRGMIATLKAEDWKYAPKSSYSDISSSPGFPNSGRRL